MAFSILFIAFLGRSSPLGMTDNIYNVGAGFSNSPGLSCRTISVASVYDQPSLTAKVLGRTQNFIAVTGGEVNGFVPMVTGRRIKGWVQTKETTVGKPSDLRGPCVVQIQPDGRLLFGWP
jgi:hypothetical protein